MPAADRIYRSPDLAGEQTARALGLAAVAEPLLREIDFGDWAGKSLMELQAEDALALSAWVTDPQATPPGGEAAIDLIARMGTWLTHLADQSARIIAVAPANCLRAAVIHCLRAPATAFRQIDVPPLSSMFLSCHQGQWRLRLSPTVTVDAAALVATGTLAADADQRLIELLGEDTVVLAMKPVSHTTPDAESLRLLAADVVPRFRSDFAARSLHDVKRSLVGRHVDEGGLFGHRG